MTSPILRNTLAPTCLVLASLITTPLSADPPSSRSKFNESIHEVVMSRPHSAWSKETPEEYAARMYVISDALEAEVSHPRSLKGWPWGALNLAAAVLAVWDRESHFDPYVHAGPPVQHPVHHQDHGHARCLGQVQSSGLIPKSWWKRTTGINVKSTQECARATIRVMRAYQYCYRRGFSMQAASAMMSGYGTGAGCRVTKNGVQKANLWQELIVRLRAVVRKNDATLPRLPKKE